jgi:hypothetical protein
VSLITPAVQLVTTRSRARTEQWTEQDHVREQAQQWVEEANDRQNEEIRTQESQRTANGKRILTNAAGPSNSGTEPDISVLAGIQVTMKLEQLLRLVPRFREGLHRTLNGTVETTATAIQLTEVDERVMDCECPSMEAIVGGQKIAGILIDGGSGVNVISMATCRQLGITKWEPCKFWLLMANGSSVRSIGMIPDLEMVMQGHTFTISVVIMDLPHQDAYPILLGRARMKHDWPKNVVALIRAYGSMGGPPGSWTEGYEELWGSTLNRRRERTAVGAG